MPGRDGRTVPRMVDTSCRQESDAGKSPVQWRWVAVLAAAALLTVVATESALGTGLPRPYQLSMKTDRPILPRVFKVDLGKGYVVYVIPNQQWQVVSVLFYGDRRGRFRMSKGVEYSVGSESSKGIADPWPDLSAKVEAGAVSAHFGPFGSIDMHFVASGGSREYRPVCRGEAVAFAGGHYEGSIRFPGGHGYPPVESVVAQVAPGWELRSRCTGGLMAEGPPALPGALLQASSVRPNTPAFSAFKNTRNGHSHIGAGINEFQRGVSITRFASVVAPASAFQYDLPLTKATVRPPAPFSGAGFYDANRERGHRWFGTLSVDLPGRKDVNLTHPPLQGFINPARWIPPHPKKQG